MLFNCMQGYQPTRTDRRIKGTEGTQGATQAGISEQPANNPATRALSDKLAFKTKCCKTTYLRVLSMLLGVIKITFHPVL